MAVSSKVLTLSDEKAEVRLTIPVNSVLTEDLDVHTTTTQLRVRSRNGDIILDIPELYGTVDASRTVAVVRNGQLIITLYKLAPGEKWTSAAAAPEVVHPMASSPSDTITSEGAMAAREMVRQLFEASLYGRIEEIESLAPKVGPNGLSSVKDGNGRNALHFAAQGAQLETASYLIRNEGINPNLHDEAGETPLGLAAGRGHSQLAAFLIDEGADLHLANPSQPQPLHRAAATGNRDMVKLLLDRGANIEAPTESGTPLHWAAGSGSQEVVETLLVAGADPNVKTPDGVTAILMASAAGDSAVVEQLVKRDANPNILAACGVSPLHAAAEYGDEATVRILIEAGADPNAMDEEESKPIHAAALNGHVAIVELLYPITKPKGNEKWSIEALMAETSSGESPSPEQAEKTIPALKPKATNPELAASCKREGDKAFVVKDFADAEIMYSESLSHDSGNHIVWANRSAARLRQGKAEEAFFDAQESRKIDPKYLKAWYREGEAARSLQKYEEAAQAFYEAYILDPSSQLVAQDFQDAVAKGREQYQRENAK